MQRLVKLLPNGVNYADRPKQVGSTNRVSKALSGVADAWDAIEDLERN